MVEIGQASDAVVQINVRELGAARDGAFALGDDGAIEVEQFEAVLARGAAIDLVDSIAGRCFRHVDGLARLPGSEGEASADGGEVLPLDCREAHSAVVDRLGGSAFATRDGEGGDACAGAARHNERACGPGALPRRQCCNGQQGGEEWFEKVAVVHIIYRLHFVCLKEFVRVVAAVTPDADGGPYQHGQNHQGKSQ